MRIIPKLKQRLNAMLIESGLRNPGAKNRHDWVGPGYHEMKRDFQFTFQKSVGLLPENTFLDLGCGTLRGGIPVIDYLDVGKYYGIDVRPKVLVEAQKELSKHGLEHKKPVILTFKEAFQQISTKFDMIWAFQVFQHMSHSKLEEALKFVARHLKPDGKFYATAITGDYSEGEWQGFPVVTRPLEFYETEAGKFGLKVLSCGTLVSQGYGRQEDEPSNNLMLKIQAGNCQT